MTKDEIETLKELKSLWPCDALDNIIKKYSEDEQDQEYNVGDVVRASDRIDNEYDRLEDMIYVGKIRNYHIVSSDKKYFNRFLNYEDIPFSAFQFYKHIIPNPKDEYLDFSEPNYRYFVRKNGTIFEINGTINNKVLKDYHKNGVRLLERIDPETGKAITKSLKVGEE